MSNLVARILFLGYFLCAATAQFQALQGSTKIARHELVFVNSAVNGRSRLPRPTLVVSQSVFRDDLASLVYCILLLNVQRCEEDAGYLPDFLI